MSDHKDISLLGIPEVGEKQWKEKKQRKKKKERKSVLTIASYACNCLHTKANKQVRGDLSLTRGGMMYRGGQAVELVRSRYEIWNFIPEVQKESKKVDS